ncbi:MAG: hypothetical protein GXY13_14475 [Acidimicrobiales bacterium]|nr:hypothetical protein [Acidimicrobiales bacterium]
MTHMSGTRSVLGAYLGAFVLVASSFAAPEQVAGSPDAQATVESSTEDVAGSEEQPVDPEDPAVTSLRREGVSVEQARAQMDAQVAAGVAEMELPGDLESAYGGRRIFHDRGGLVQITVTQVSKADAIRAHFARYGIDNLEIASTRYPAAEMERVVEDLQVRVLESRTDGSERAVDVLYQELGHITVEFVPGAVNEIEADIVRTAQSDPELYSVIPVDSVSEDEELACDMTDRIECDPPLRGGQLTHTPNGCTLGFVVRSESDNLPYAMTAGHCDDYGHSVNWITDFSDESDHAIGPFHNSRNDTQTDVGIWRVNNPTGWSFGWPLVTVSPYGGGQGRNENYVIERVLNPGIGDRVCWTGGNSTFTYCGDVDVLYGTAGGTAGLFRVPVGCPDGGDSGGPHFASNVAYGILSAGNPDACDGVWAEQAPEAAGHMNVYILTA